MIECISTTDEPNIDNIQVVEVNTNEEGTEAVESAVTNILAVFVPQFFAERVNRLKRTSSK